MNAKPTLRAMLSRGYRGPGLWILTVLVLVGALVQACSDNKGPDGPTFPSGVTGTAPTNAGETVQVAVNPNSLTLLQRAGITVLVKNQNGLPLAGRHVQMSTTAGNLDRVDGFTDADGKFVTFILCENSWFATSASISAFVDGVTSPTVSVGCGTVAQPAAGGGGSSSPGPTSFQLSLNITGDGTGTVTSSPAGINCSTGGTPGNLCVASFSTSPPVTLKAVFDNTTMGFAGWINSAFCSGTGDCTLSLTASTAVTAKFCLGAGVTSC